ncbi:MAG: single-stranded-DNA-specific exonuclease RecJ [Candidatus Taylorbacteria bacterium]|nr:single-stranded-DNA-specific exonuclease RecJ [Candidatus Taylorbacteria bacterium]
MRYALRERPAKPESFSAFSDTLSALLLSRGVLTISDAEAFLSPDYDRHIHDPFLMRDMDRAVERLYKAVKSGERTVIFSDYDADGIPGAVVLHDAFKKIGYTNFENYIPHRHDEGFGLNLPAIEGFKERGATLLITIDCGIGNLDEVAHAQKLGMDVIVTDHHMPLSHGATGEAHETLPPAFAILNPKVEGCSYPEKMLCGSGVIFKLVQAFLKRHGAEFGVNPGWEKWLLDMVGIATLSDMVPLTGENRTLAYYGLKVLKKTPRAGLSKLFEKLRVKREHISEDDIGFTLTPRINAASRMGAPDAAFNLLSTEDEALAGAYADALEHVNNERKGTVASLVKEIRKALSERNIEDKQVIVIGNPLWRPSLLGLVANTLAEEYGKPAFLWGRDGDNKIKGSARSGGNASVLSIMQRAPEAFAHYGGHAASGGFEVADDAIHFLEEKLDKAAQGLAFAKDDARELVDAHISLEDVSWNLYREIEKLSPYGTGNPKPLFLIKGALVDSVKSFGKEGNHTEISFRDLNGRKVTAIQFFAPKESLPKHVAPQALIDLVVHLEKSTFKNYPELRLRIVDII